jgi:tetraacyldisaccharide 4'-kinase
MNPLERRWYSGEPPAVLRPLAALYGWAAERRRRRAVPERLPVPVIVVGNLTVGGTGKTPVVIALVERLRARGRRPGVVARGYGARVGARPRMVRQDSLPAEVGDEPLLVHRATGVPVVVHPDRVAAARGLLAAGVDVIVSDDGLQHHRLGRDVALCVVDGRRGLGNGALLPAGPLREPAERLHSVDAVLVNGGDWAPPASVQRWGRFELEPGEIRRLDTGAPAGVLSAWRGRRVRALAGIGNPQRFFDTLRAAGLELESVQAFPDHHRFRPADLPPAHADCPLLMTEKDAVKCRAFAPTEAYVLPVRAALPWPLLDPLLDRLLAPEA